MLTTFDPQEMTNPYPFYERARQETPVFFDAASGLWIVCTYPLVHEVLTDKGERFSAEADRASFAGLCPEAISILEPIEFSRLYGLSTTENPDHDRLKRVARPIFNELYLSRLKPRLQAIANEYLDALSWNDAIDLVPTLCNPFPAAASFTILGIPREDVPRVKRWCASRLALTWGEAAEQVYHARNVVQYWEYCKELVERKLIEPGDDLPSALAPAVRDKILTLHEVQLFCYGLMFSGHATTSAFLAEALRMLFATGAWSEIAADARGADSTADELLRLCPSAFTRRRLVLKDVVVGDQRIEKGQTILLVIGSANRDEELFPEPNELELNRKNSYKQLSFGYGFHYCIGAKIVKLEYGILLDEMMRRWPRLHLAPGYVPKYNRNLSVRMPETLLACRS